MTKWTTVLTMPQRSPPLDGYDVVEIIQPTKLVDKRIKITFCRQV